MGFNRHPFPNQLWHERMQMSDFRQIVPEWQSWREDWYCIYSV